MNRDPIDAALAAEAAAQQGEVDEAETAKLWLKAMRRAFKGIMDETARKRFLAAAAKRLNE